jgi:ribulose-phosphate 3-epimerase
MLSADPTNLGQALFAVERAGADAVHWDVMDGVFVDAITFGSSVIAAHRGLSRLRFDVHLMTIDPDKHLKSFADAGADVLVVHIEACLHLHRTMTVIKSLGKKVGVAFNPATHWNAIEYCAEVLDMVVVMTVNPGSSGQDFLWNQLEKISALRRILPSSVEICVDGGISDQTIADCAQCGADSCVSGSYIFQNNDRTDDAIRRLKENCT